MANTLSVMTNVLRNVVSKQRIRYKEKGFNLDLAYICDNIIAMGYPADSIESFYRNRIEDVYKFLEENHHDHYKIYNLCLERSYDINKFHGRVAVYPFEDHNPPTIQLIQQFCNDVDSWLKSDSSNVAAIHCKAGKGRTGTMICCYLLYSGLQRTAEDALACYDEKRTKDRKGVTIPSQRRYVQYFANLIQSGLQYEKRILQFCEIRFEDASLLYSHGNVNCSVAVLQDNTSEKIQTLQTYTIDFRKNLTLHIQNPSLTVAGDIKVELTHKTSRKKILHFWLNTYFVLNTADVEVDGKERKLIYTLHKNEIDDAHKDREHKCFSEDFKVQVVFLPVNSIETKSYVLNTFLKSGNQTRIEDLEDSNSTQNNEILLQNFGNCSDKNFIIGQNSSLYSGACGISINTGRRSITNELIQEKESSNAILSNNVCTETVGTNEETVPNMPSERIQNHTPFIPSVFYQLVQSLPVSVSALTPINYHQMHQNHKNSDLEKHVAKQNQRMHEKLQNVKPTCKPRRINNIEQTGTIALQLLNKTSGNTMIKACSSSRSNSSSSIAVDNEEDWESGEFSSKPLELKALHFSDASNKKKKMSLNMSNNFDCSSENKVCGYNKVEIENYSRNIHNTLVLNLKKNLCQIVDTKYSVLQTGPVEELVRYDTVAEATTNKNFLFKRNSLKPRTEVKSVVLRGSELSCFSSNTSSCNNTSSLATISNQKLKTKLNKNKIKLSKKFDWFQKYFRNDPVDFCETFVQQTTTMRRNSSSGNRNHKLSTSTQIVGCFPELCSTSPFFVNEKLNRSSLMNAPRHVSLHEESLQENHIAIIPHNEKTSPSIVSNIESYDFYSSACEKQLSFTNSACKSPRFVNKSCNNENKLSCVPDKPTTQNNQNKSIDAAIKNVVVINASPVKTKSIGFNVAEPIKNLSEEINISASFSKNTTSCNELKLLNKNPFLKHSSTDFSSSKDSSEREVGNANISALPFIFTQMDKELNNLEVDQSSAGHLEKNEGETSQVNQSTVLNLIIINDVTSSSDCCNSQMMPVDDHLKNESKKYITDCVVGGIIISACSNSSSNSVCTSGSCTNCKCNPFPLDLEKYNCKTTQSVIQKSLEFSTNKTQMSKSSESKKSHK